MSSITQAQAPGTSNYSSQNSPVITLGSTPPVNSIILIAVWANENGGAVTVNTPPPGFTLVAEDARAGSIHSWLYYRIATAGESTSWQLFFNRNCCCVLVASNYQGGDTANWIDVFTSAHGTTNTVQSGSIATHNTVSERWISFLGTQYVETFGSPSNSFTTVTSANKNPGTLADGITYGMFTRDLSAPTLGPATMSCNVGTNRDNCGIIIALQERLAITYVKTGNAVVGNSKLSGAKSRDVAKAGRVTSDQTKVQGARASVINRTGVLVSAGVLGGARPNFYTKAGTLRSDTSLLSGTKVLVHGATIVRDPLDAVFGFASGKVSTTGSGPFQGAYISFTPLTTNKHTVSLYLKSNDPLRLKITNAAGVLMEVSSTIAPTINWARQVYTTTAQLLAGTTYRLYIETTQAVATTFWIDGVQVEEGLVASPFTVGAKLSGGGPVGAVLREQKPAGLVMTYIVAPGSPTSYPTYQELYDHHPDYTDVMDTEQDYQQVFLSP